MELSDLLTLEREGFVSPEDVELTVTENFGRLRGVKMNLLDGFLGVMVARFKDKRLRRHIGILIAGTVAVNPHTIDVHILVKCPDLLIGVGENKADMVFVCVCE